MWEQFNLYRCDLTVISLTYDDVRLDGSAGVCREVTLDLVSSLIEQVQVVFHWVSIMEALTEANDTWQKEKYRVCFWISGKLFNQKKKKTVAEKMVLSTNPQAKVDVFLFLPSCFSTCVSELIKGVIRALLLSWLQGDLIKSKLRSNPNSTGSTVSAHFLVFPIRGQCQVNPLNAGLANVFSI